MQDIMEESLEVNLPNLSFPVPVSRFLSLERPKIEFRDKVE